VYVKNPVLLQMQRGRGICLEVNPYLGIIPRKERNNQGGEGLAAVLTTSSREKVLLMRMISTRFDKLVEVCLILSVPQNGREKLCGLVG
jgi:hypothetical protein